MLLDVLLFFLPLILGGWANSFMAGKRRSASFVAVVIVVCFGYEILAFHMPFHSLCSEVLYAIVGTVAVVLLMIGFPFEELGKRTPTRATSYPYAVLLLPLIFTIMSRADHAQKVAARWEGTVISKYHSRNHSSPSFIVRGTDGSTVTLEDVDAPAWNAAAEGGSHITKPAWSAYGELDGKHLRIVRQARVMFLGPFPD